MKNEKDLETLKIVKRYLKKGYIEDKNFILHLYYGFDFSFSLDKGDDPTKSDLHLLGITIYNCVLNLDEVHKLCKEIDYNCDEFKHLKIILTKN